MGYIWHCCCVKPSHFPIVIVLYSKCFPRWILTSLLQLVNYGVVVIGMEDKTAYNWYKTWQNFKPPLNLLEIMNLTRFLHQSIRCHVNLMPTKFQLIWQSFARAAALGLTPGKKADFSCERGSLLKIFETNHSRVLIHFLYMQLWNVRITVPKMII